MSLDAWGVCFVCDSPVLTDEQLADIKGIAHYRCYADREAALETRISTMVCPTCGDIDHTPDCPANRFLKGKSI